MKRFAIAALLATVAAPAFADDICDHFEMIEIVAAEKGVKPVDAFPENLKDGSVWVNANTKQKYVVEGEDEGICLVKD